MKLATLLAATLLATGASAQTFTDPANLRGERPRPSDGRELPVDQGAKGLQQLLRKLNTRASLMLIVAHPDDEDGGMLTLYSRGLGARVAMLTLNRGEGGQNAMTGDFEDALGLLRTQELLAADRYFNVDQMFGTEVDFGFSKTKEEAFAKWTHERVLYDAVRAVRIYRPLVIAAVFIGGVTDGHGQHQVSGQIAQEVFNAAGDPKVFPELTAEGILPWQPLKVYARVPMQSISAQGLFDYATGQYTPAKFTNYVTGEVTTTQPSVDVVVHEGTPDPLLDGKSYVQFARMGLGLQRSQIGPGVRNAPPGAFDVSYHLYGSKLPSTNTNPQAPTARSIPAQGNALGRQMQKDARAEGPAYDPAQDLDSGFFNGIDTSILGLQDLDPLDFPTDILADITRAISTATNRFDPAHTEATAPLLAIALKDTDTLIAAVEKGRRGSPAARANALHELRIKRVQLNDALALSLGTQADATVDTAGTGNVTQGSQLHIQTTLSTSPGVDTYVEAVWQLTGPAKGMMDFDIQRLDRREHFSGHPAVAQPMDIEASKNILTAAVTRPYFTRKDVETPVYDLLNPELRNAPATPPAVIVWSTVDYAGVKVQVGRVVHDGTRPITVVPSASLSFFSHAQVLPNNESALRADATLSFWPLGAEAHGAIPNGAFSLIPTVTVPNGWEASFQGSDGPWHLLYQIKAPSSRSGMIAASASVVLPGHETISEGIRSVGYGDLPRTNYFTPATVRIVPVDLKLPTRTRIAYLPGTGDSLPDALTSINLKPTILTLADLTATNLAQYDTVILGVRTYNAHPDLHGAPTQALFEYARNGGNVIVQFQTAEFTAADAPYPITLGRAELVSDETAPVQLLEPASPLLSTPNKITPADFNNWVAERGHGFLRTWDPHYTALAETHDPGQAPQLGGLITTQLGKGRWTYCAFALYRQLPEAVPGAYRLFANLLNP